MRTVECVSCKKNFQTNHGKKTTCSAECAEVRNFNRRKVYRLENIDNVRAWTNKTYPRDRVKRLAASARSRIKYRATLEVNCLRRVEVMIRSIKNGALRRGLEFLLDPIVIHTMIIAQGDRCSITGIKFDWSFDKIYRANPYAPSIDRRDSTKGYTYDNIQIICYQVNLAKNEYPIELFDKMCEARMKYKNAW